MYGIKKQNNFIFCGSCGRVVSKDGTYDSNYCFTCGNPLKAEAIKERQELLNNQRLGLIEELKEIAKEEETDSLKEILEDFQ